MSLIYFVCLYKSVLIRLKLILSIPFEWNFWTDERRKKSHIHVNFDYPNRLNPFMMDAQARFLVSSANTHTTNANHPKIIRQTYTMKRMNAKRKRKKRIRQIDHSHTQAHPQNAIRNGVYLVIFFLFSLSLSLDTNFNRRCEAKRWQASSK